MAVVPNSNNPNINSSFVTSDLMKAITSSLRLSEENTKNINKFFLQTTVKDALKKDTFLKDKKETDTQKLLIDNNKLLTSIATNTKDFGKDSDKKKGGFFGSLLAAGGLVAFLLTGKNEHLQTMAKGLLKYGPIKMVSGFFKFISGSMKGIGKLFAKGGLKGVGKGIMKGGKLAKFGKGFLKKIPGVGAIMGLLFGINRFKKGDTLGGLLEIGSGLAGAIPGIGTGISIALDSFLLMRDLKGDDWIKSKAKTGIKAAKRKLSDLSDVPGIGSIIRVTKAFIDYTKNPLKALRDIISVADEWVPGLGGKIGSAVDWVYGLRDHPLIKKVSKISSIGKGIASKGISKAKSFMGSGKIGGGIRKIGSLFGISRKSTGIKYGGGIPPVFRRDRVSDVSGVGLDEDVKSVVGQRTKGYFLKNDNVNIAGINPNMMHNFEGMALEYNLKTGKSIQINSGFRSLAKQAALHADNPERAVEAGRSLHNYGFAMDVQSSAVNELSSMGLMKKWGFHRPLVDSTYPEPWHIEPKGIKRKSIRFGHVPVIPKYDSGEMGDAYALNPLPVNVKAINSNLANRGNIPQPLPNIRSNMDASLKINQESINKIIEGFYIVSKKTQTNIQNNQVIIPNGRS